MEVEKMTINIDPVLIRLFPKPIKTKTNQTKNPTILSVKFITHFIIYPFKHGTHTHKVEESN